MTHTLGIYTSPPLGYKHLGKHVFNLPPHPIYLKGAGRTLLMGELLSISLSLLLSPSLPLFLLLLLATSKQYLLSFWPHFLSSPRTGKQYLGQVSTPRTGARALPSRDQLQAPSLWILFPCWERWINALQTSQSLPRSRYDFRGKGGWVTANFSFRRSNKAACLGLQTLEPDHLDWNPDS